MHGCYSKSRRAGRKGFGVSGRQAPASNTRQHSARPAYAWRNAGFADSHPHPHSAAALRQQYARTAPTRPTACSVLSGRSSTLSAAATTYHHVARAGPGRPASVRSACGWLVARLSASSSFIVINSVVGRMEGRDQRTDRKDETKGRMEGRTDGRTDGRSEKRMEGKLTPLVPSSPVPSAHTTNQDAASRPPCSLCLDRV